MDLQSLEHGLLETVGRFILREAVEEDDVQVITETNPFSFVGHVVLPCLGGVGFEGPAAESEEEARARAIQLCLETFGSAADAARAALHSAAKLRPHPPKEPPNAKLLPDHPVVVNIDDGPDEADSEQPLAVGRQPEQRTKPRVKAMPRMKAPASAVLPPAMEPKALLHSMLMKATGKQTTKADVEYNVQGVEEGWQCILVLNSLGGRGFAGYPCNKKDAEQSAAVVAIEWMRDNVSAEETSSRKRPQTDAMALPVDVEVPPAKRPRKAAEPARKLSSTSIPSQEGIDFCAEWRDTRLEPCQPEEIQDPSSIDYYFGQVCLVCQAIVSIKGWDAHATGKKHLQRLQAQPMKLREGVERPAPSPPCELLDPALFAEMGGWGTPDELGEYPSVLTLGEMDYSFSLAVARLRPPGACLVATSYLAEHDPLEVEIHPSDDGERAAYKRHSLPGMRGALQQNLHALADLGSQVFHSVDATDLAGTLLAQGAEGGFHSVVFPFPRFSLSRAPNPNNSRLLREFFTSVIRDGVLLEGGNIQLVMLCAQYEEWDVNGMATDVGLVLISRVALPTSFYQAREMSGKPWTPPGAELLTFQVAV